MNERQRRNLLSMVGFTCNGRRGTAERWKNKQAKIGWYPLNQCFEMNKVQRDTRDKLGQILRGSLKESRVGVDYNTK